MLMLAAFLLFMAVLDFLAYGRLSVVMMIIDWMTR